MANAVAALKEGALAAVTGTAQVVGAAGQAVGAAGKIAGAAVKQVGEVGEKGVNVAGKAAGAALNVAGTAANLTGSAAKAAAEAGSAALGAAGTLGAAGAKTAATVGSAALNTATQAGTGAAQVATEGVKLATGAAGAVLGAGTAFTMYLGRKVDASKAKQEAKRRAIDPSKYFKAVFTNQYKDAVQTLIDSLGGIYKSSKQQYDILRDGYKRVYCQPGRIYGYNCSPEVQQTLDKIKSQLTTIQTWFDVQKPIMKGTIQQVATNINLIRDTEFEAIQSKANAIMSKYDTQIQTTVEQAANKFQPIIDQLSGFMDITAAPAAGGARYKKRRTQHRKSHRKQHRKSRRRQA